MDGIRSESEETQRSAGQNRHRGQVKVRVGPGQYRAGGRVGPESDLDEPRQFSGKSSGGLRAV